VALPERAGGGPPLAPLPHSMAWQSASGEWLLEPPPAEPVGGSRKCRKRRSLGAFAPSKTLEPPLARDRGPICGGRLQDRAALEAAIMCFAKRSRATTRSAAFD